MDAQDLNSFSRRLLVKSSIFGLLAVSVPNVSFSRNPLTLKAVDKKSETIPARYPAIREKVVAEVVGVSHFNLERLKELVDPRPELAKATWDWGFGDWESAIGAASHVGRKDIVEYLLGKGAMPTIFTFAMLGAFEAVKSMIVFSPGIQRISGPHGISLLQHVKNGLQNNTADKSNAEKLAEYLMTLGDADGQKYMTVSEADQQKYLGDYKYGDGANEGFTISLNMRKILSLGKIGKFGGALYKIGENKFTYNGAPSVEISFSIQNDVVNSLTVKEPDLTLIAVKVWGE